MTCHLLIPVCPFSPPPVDLYILPGAFQTLLFPLHFTGPRTQECINNGYLNENKVCVYMDEWMGGWMLMDGRTGTIVPQEK